MRLTRILVIDDQLDSSRLIKTLLQDRGYLPTLCNNWEEACKEIEEKRVFMVIINYTILNKYKLNLLRKIKKKNHFAEFIILIDIDHLQEALKNHAYCACTFLLKPIRKHSVYETLNRTQEAINLKLKACFQPKSAQRLIRQRVKQIFSKENQGIFEGALQGIIQNLLDPVTVIIGRSELLKSELNKACNEVIYAEKNQDIQDLNNHLPKLPQPISVYLDRVKQHVEKINKNSQKILEGINSLTKKEAFHLFYTPDYMLEINTLILQEMDLFNHNPFYKQKIKKFYHLDFKLPPIKMTYSTLSQVLHHLITNALEAMRESPIKELTINTSQDDQYIYISIADTGIGVPLSIRARIFEPFFTFKSFLKESNYPDASKMGLGLNICQELLRPYSGDIKLQTQLKGSQFIISLPRSLSYLGIIDQKATEPLGLQRIKYQQDEKTKKTVIQHSG